MIYSTPYMNCRATTRGVFKAYVVFFLRYYWEKNGKRFSPDESDGQIAVQPGVGTLIFARPLEEDEGYYQCFAENTVGTALSVKVNLRKTGEWHSKYT